MAASKLHLKNLDKNYKLKKTDKVTTEGKPIYVNTLTGEEHSELSMTLEYPANSGKWVNVPSLLNGRVYNSKGVLAMLKAGRLTVTSTHMNEQEASEAAAYRSTTLQSNTGETLKPANEIADFDPAKQAFINQNMNTFASTFPTRDENPEGLFVVDNALDDQILGTDQASMEKIVANNNAVNNAENNFQNQDTIDPLQEYRQKEAKLLEESKNLSNSNRQRLEQIDKLAAIMDRANAEKDDSYFYENTDPMGRTSLVDKYRMGDLYKGLKKAENPEMNAYKQTPVSAADQAMFDAAYKQRNFPDAGPKTRQSNKPGVDAKNLNPDEQMQNSYNSVPSMMANGPDRRQSNKPEFNFKYKPHMNPEEKMKDNRNLKGLSPEYGKMPGFKFVSAGTKDPDAGYWSADENSQFWKTDAGYEKAQQTWGNTGTLPNYVKRPVKKELDVNAIKKFFGSNN